MQQPRQPADRFTEIPPDVLDRVADHRPAVLELRDYWRRSISRLAWGNRFLRQPLTPDQQPADQKYMATVVPSVCGTIAHLTQ